MFFYNNINKETTIFILTIKIRLGKSSYTTVIGSFYTSMVRLGVNGPNSDVLVSDPHSIIIKPINAYP
ncbi:hypothetical protein QTP88_019011 [Uroleucon formosanum]